MTWLTSNIPLQHTKNKPFEPANHLLKGWFFL